MSENYKYYDSNTDSVVEVYDLVPCEKPKKKKNNFMKNTAAICLVTVLGGTSFGFGLGASGMLPNKNMERQIASQIEQSLQGEFSMGSNNISGITNVATKMAAIQSSPNSVVDVIKTAANSVVSINVSGTARNIFNQVARVASAGSGIIIGEDETKLYIATNNHVIEGANSVTISLDDTSQVKANYVGSEYQSDLAVISVTKTAMKAAGISDYKIATIGNSKGIEVGEIVVAIGNAAGEGKTATMGIISAKNKTLAVDDRTLSVIQTDAAINPGNSGGALVNASGQIVGINTAKLSETGIEGMGYAIPIDKAKITIDQLIKNGTVTKPYLGIQGVDIDDQIKEAYQFPSIGVYVDSVLSGSGAEDGGLKAGDIIVGFGKTKINKMDDLTKALTLSKASDKVTIYAYRGSSPITLEVTLKDLNQKF